jgi:hypothetical protein
MTVQLGAIACVAAASLAIASIIETSSWWIKGSSPRDKMGLYINRSNIFLYFGRTFVLVFTGLIAFAIERGATPHFVAAALTLSFALSCLAHILLMRGDKMTLGLLAILDKILVLPDPLQRDNLYRNRLNRSLLLGTAGSNFLFTLSFTIPLQLAVTFPAFRLSLSYTGQIVNAVGTIYLLFYVDQKLFRSMDEGNLHLYLPSYSYGRILAYGSACLMCAVLVSIV